MTTFACCACGSPAFTMDGALTDDTEVLCAECGAPLGSWAIIRQQLQERLAPKNSRHQAVMDDPKLPAPPIVAYR